MSKFKVGDRVKCIYGVPRGEVGTIYKYENEDSFLVDFDTWRSGHQDSDQKGPNYRGFWWTSATSVELLSEAKIMTLTEGRTIELCKTLADAGCRIEAIKLWREFSGAGIKEAKDFIEAGCVKRETIKVGDRVKTAYGSTKGTVVSILGEHAWVNEDGFGPYTYELTDLMLAA